jgi:hypothetical protein
MALRHLPVTALVAALFTSASSAEMQPASDLSVAYRWTNGTVAPWYSTEYFIEIRSQGESEISLHMGRQEGEEQKVTEEFSPDPVELQALIDYIRRKHKSLIFASAHFRSAPTPPGSGLCGLVLVESGTTHALPCGFGGKPSLAERVRYLVPETVMRLIDGQHADFLAKRAARQRDAAP